MSDHIQQRNCADLPSHRCEWLPPLLLAAAVLIIFRQAGNFGFTNWDDSIYIADNPVLQRLDWGQIRRIFTPGGVPRELLYIPITYLSLLLEMQLWQGNPGPMHATQILLHLANCLLVYAFLRRCRLALLPALLGALVFAVHPLQVEAVAWLMGRKDLLSACFALLSLHCFLYYLRNSGRSCFVVSLFAAGLAMLSKPTLIVLPILLFLLAVRERDRCQRIRCLPLLPFLVIAVLVFLLNGLMPVETDFTAPPPAQRLPAIVWLGWHWFVKLLPLSRPTPIYPWPVRLPWLGLLPATLLIAVIVYGFKHRRAWLWFGPSFFLIMLAPAVKVVLDGRDFVTADRYGYLALLGVACFCAAALQRTTGRSGRPARVAVLIWLLLLAALAFQSVSVWRSSKHVWDRVLSQYPDCVLALMNRGNTLAEQGRRQEAEVDFRRALELAPDNYQVRLNLGIFYCRNGQFRQALPHLRNAVERKPHYWRGHYQLGLALSALKQPEAALKEFQAAARRRQTTEILFALAQSLEQNGRAGAAWEVYRQIVEQSPDHTLAYYNLANMYRRAGQLQAAEAHYRLALGTDPDHVESRINLGITLIDRGEPETAAKELKQALALKSPYEADIFFHLGRAHVAANRPEAARSALQNALEQEPDYDDAKQLLKQLDDGASIRPN